MESYVFSKLSKECFREKINIPLASNEELSIHLIKTPFTEYAKTIITSDDGENEIYHSHPCYVNIDYLFLWFLVETANMVEMHLVLDYDREQETFIHIPKI